MRKDGVKSHLDEEAWGVIIILSLLFLSDPNSNQTAEEVLALNAAAVIANIKLQRKLSKKKSPEDDSAPGNTGITTVLPSSRNHNFTLHRNTAFFWN